MIMAPAAIEPFRQLQVLTMLVLALMVAPSALPPARRYGRRLRIAALALYLAGGLAILANWLLTRN
jgi:hypothetical protein